MLSQQFDWRTVVYSFLYSYKCSCTQLVRSIYSIVHIHFTLLMMLCVRSYLIVSHLICQRAYNLLLTYCIVQYANFQHGIYKLSNHLYVEFLCIQYIHFVQSKITKRRKSSSLPFRFYNMKPDVKIFKSECYLVIKHPSPNLCLFSLDSFLRAVAE